MRDAALHDFAQIPDVEIVVTCDQRLAAPLKAHQVLLGQSSRQQPNPQERGPLTCERGQGCGEHLLGLC